MLHAGFDLCRKRLDVCLLPDEGEHLDQLAVAPDVDSLRVSPAASRRSTASRSAR